MALCESILKRDVEQKINEPRGPVQELYLEKVNVKENKKERGKDMTVTYKLKEEDLREAIKYYLENDLGLSPNELDLEIIIDGEKIKFGDCQIEASYEQD